MNLIFLIVIVFIVPFALALYVWRDEEPKNSIYYMCLSVSALALVALVLGGDAVEVIMPLGLFMASTSFFAGVFLSAIVRRMRGKG